VTAQEVSVRQQKYPPSSAGRTLEDIGQTLQLSRERVRQLEARALAKLRHPSCHRRLRSVLEN
jgi:DNA-directed RNA polymerase sigma subunit (sigma70/sigma32)